MVLQSWFPNNFRKRIRARAERACGLEKDSAQLWFSWPLEAYLHSLQNK
jgi:hypothetical protein